LFNVLEFIINLRATLRFFFGKTSIWSNLIMF
jgi:hypothetical protein